ncbi:MAG TPA: hypothetical protein VID75_04480 [Acidimicrobiales bacterium]|jgi:hypothetical protein
MADGTEEATERFEVTRPVKADRSTIFRLLCDPHGHVTIDSSGMLMDATGEPVAAVGDSFVVHMDREALNDRPMGRYDVIVTIATFVPDSEIAWTVAGVTRSSVGHVYGYRLEPDPQGTLVTSYYDWSAISAELKETGIFPVLPEGALRATLGILARTVEDHNDTGAA